MKTSIMYRAALALLGVFFISNNVFAYVIGASYIWDPSTPNYNPLATVYDGTIDTNTLMIGDFLGRDASNPNATTFGSSGAAVGWDDTWVGGVGDANTNGDALDGLWVQIYDDGGWWDLGATYNRVSVSSSQDHGPYLGEGTEYRVFGTNTLWDDTSLSAQASITELYLDGWRTHNSSEDANRNGWLSDDITGVFQLDDSYRYIKLLAWGGGTFFEPEIDAVAGIPEPTTLILMCFGLAGIGLRRRKLAG